MSDVESYANDLKKLAKHAVEFKQKINSVCNGEFKYGVEKVIESYLSMFERFCPFKVGDRVELTKNNVIKNKSSGWYHCQHFMKKGVTATIAKRDYLDDQFCFYIIFDNETWIDGNGFENPIKDERKHHFGFGESWLKSI